MTIIDDRAASVPHFEMRHRLRLALEYSRVSVKQMADALDLGRNTITNYLSGRSRPSKATRQAWAFRCGVPFEWIETGEAPAESPEGGVPRSILGDTRRYVHRFPQILAA